MIGGGYATGREIVEYGAKYGALGWLSGLGTFLGFAVIAALTYELIRLTKAYDFKTFMKTIGGPLWIVFDIVYLLFMVVIIAVMASATGNIVEQTLGLNYWVGVVAITVVVAILNFYGSRLIERFETLGTVALYAGYIIFSVLVIGTFGKNISTVFANHDTSFIEGSVSAGKALLERRSLLRIQSGCNACNLLYNRKTDQKGRIRCFRYYRRRVGYDSLVPDILCGYVLLSES